MGKVALISATCRTLRTIPFCSYLRNPSLLKVRVYCPMGRLVMLYNPRSLVVAVLRRLVPTLTAGDLNGGDYRAAGIVDRTGNRGTVRLRDEDSRQQEQHQTESDQSRMHTGSFA